MGKQREMEKKVKQGKMRKQEENWKKEKKWKKGKLENRENRGKCKKRKFRIQGDRTNKSKQAGAELCQAQPKLGLDFYSINFNQTKYYCTC